MTATFFLTKKLLVLHNMPAVNRANSRLGTRWARKNASIAVPDGADHTGLTTANKLVGPRPLTPFFLARLAYLTATYGASGLLLLFYEGVHHPGVMTWIAHHSVTARIENMARRFFDTHDALVFKIVFDRWRLDL